MMSPTTGTPTTGTPTTASPDVVKGAALVLGALGAGLPIVTVVLAAVRGVSIWALIVDHDAVGITSGFLSAVVAVLISRHDRANRLVWALLVPALSIGVYDCTRQLTPMLSPSTPGWEIASWLALWTNLPAIMVGGLQFFVFPDGRLPTRRWRPLAVAGVTATLVVTVVQATVTWPARVDPGSTSTTSVTFNQVFLVGFTLSMVFFVLSLGSLIARYRGAGVIARQQIKWVLWSQIVTVPLQLTAGAGAVGAVLELITIPLTFGAIAISILRHQLFDIDRLVSRTMVYAMLSAFMVGAYALGVLVVGQAVNGTRRPSSIVVALTTLGVASVFQPLRRRLQDGVDRRFNRRRYDAVKTIDALATHLRDDTDTTGLRAEIMAVLTDTMQPSQASLWLRTRSAADSGRWLPERPGAPRC